MGFDPESRDTMVMWAPTERLTEALNRPATSVASRWRRIGPVIDRELNHIARNLLRQLLSVGWKQTLEPGELVAEFYLRILEDDTKRWVDRKHFFAYASACMRSILTDRHRARTAAKRLPHGGTFHIEPLGAGVFPRLEIQMALEKLEKMSPRQADIVEMRFFGGWEIAEIARTIQVSEKTVQREWLAARAWLHAELTGTRLGA
jgi:RNA polymerase sigma-70 factor (ECF subfamily)